VAYFNEQNAKIDQGVLKGEKVVVSALLINKLHEDFYAHNGCKVQEEACYAAGNDATSNKICQDANDYCVRFPLGYLVTTRN
jgi:hypothetical protein